ncbi:50S ribosomal protein L15 [Candidatus Comchoanobacter bicostacola]|uniref:Large ribosomal subunit protein uL15 n=1 Tax=Candidatus Comchoanobacter bicostacola TaxID=2919598 RepID=A0ABY5DKD6_9GAMM|nr:50S ribosomal protein L15 [Candidatus Comchoanobacter bicostacola]UTC24280.1 50S ribosomal protein L15 [Candidatus Comchoanobacter bicostacola]
MNGLNTLKPAPGSVHKKLRKGRGSSGKCGDTAGRGYKGQKSRSGGNIRAGFEGGQTPFYRVTPKSGFTSRKSLYRIDLPVSVLNKLSADEPITLSVLSAANLIKKSTKFVKFYAAGKLDRAYKISGIGLTKGAKEILESVGGELVES